ncbi:MAG: FtsX-like permease family protein [Candidatus Lokiarchaeota archaeon]|nr:FtsX-like permease family protein [Candidatus Lokiarchaeota archaeon]
MVRLKFRYLLKFSTKNAFRKKSTAILSSLGVSIGLMLVFVVGAYTAGVQAQFNDNLTRTLGIVNIIEETEILIPTPDSNLPLTIIDDLINTVEVGEFIIDYNVESQAPYSYTIEYWDKLENPDDKLIVVGLNKSLDANWRGFTTRIIQGRNFEIGQNETIISSRLASIADFPVSIGSNITLTLDLLGNETLNLKIVGIYEQIEDGTPPFVPRNYAIFTDIQTIWDARNQSGDETDIYTMISLRFDVNTHEDTLTIVDRINNFSNIGGYDPTYISAYSLYAFYETVEQNLEIINSFTGILGTITALAGGMAIIVGQLMSVSSRMKEFAILKATGWKRRHIITNIIYESLTLSLLGAAGGLAIGVLLIFLLSGNLTAFGNTPIIITVPGIIEVVAYAVLLGVLGGLYPGIKASKVRPVKVLKEL